jgi:signal transduction histidine kinase
MTSAPERAAPGLPRLRLKLGTKLALGLAAVLLVMATFLLLWFGPAATRSFLERCNILVERGQSEMTQMARENAASGRDVLLTLIQSLSDRRGRTLADLPLSLYGGDVARMRAAILREDAARDARLERNVDVLAAEMERRGLGRIEAHVAQVAAEQRALGEAFGQETRRSFVVLGAVGLAALLLVLGVGLWRFVVSPVTILRRATRAAAAGDLTTEIGIGSGDEIGALAADFAAMLAELRRSRVDLQQLNASLESEVARQTENLQRALADLKRTQRQLVHSEKMSSLGMLAGGIAHEFNNLIGGIRGCARELLAGETSPERREALEVILRATERGAAVTDRLLRFARPRVERFADVDVASVLEDSLRLVQAEAKRLGVTIVRSFATGLVVHADENALHQVFLNLLTNALRAMPQGGRLEVAAAADDRELRVRVTDTGRGITAADLPHIFVPFFTSGDDPGTPGTGLGLSVSHGIVEAHGGTIEVESTPGAGSTFTVRIPRPWENASGQR